MRFGFAPIRGSNPRASAREQALRRSGEVPVLISMIINAFCWTCAAPSMPGGGQDAVYRRPADAGQLVDAVLADPGGDGQRTRYHFEGRSFAGWHRHVTLAALARAFCTMIRADPKARAPG
jgi:hypothetical protein